MKRKHKSTLQGLHSLISRNRPDEEKDIKTIRRNFAYNELDTLADVITEQAAEGWELTSKTGGVLGFRRAESRRIKAACELVYPDYGPEAEGFIEFCQAAGWRHIFSDDTLQIFETEDLDAEPIHTDPQVKLQQVHRRCLTGVVLPSIGWICFALFFMWLFCWDPDYDQYLSAQYEMGLFLGPLCILESLTSMGRYFLWYAGARKAVSRGEPAVYRKNPTIEKIAAVLDNLYVAAMVLSILICAWRQWEDGEVRIMFFWFVLMAVVSLALIFYLQRRDARKGTGGRAGRGKYVLLSVGLILLLIAGNMMITNLDFSGKNDLLKVSMEDLGIQTTGETERSRDRFGLLFLQQESGSDLSENQKGGKFFYDIFTTKDEDIYQKVLKQRYRFLYDSSRNVRQMSPEVFGAKEAYHYKSSDQRWQTWVLLYEGRIVSVEANFDLTEEQLTLIGEKLGDDVREEK